MAQLMNSLKPEHSDRFRTKQSKAKEEQPKSSFPLNPTDNVTPNKLVACEEVTNKYAVGKYTGPPSPSLTENGTLFSSIMDQNLEENIPSMEPVVIYSADSQSSMNIEREFKVGETVEGCFRGGDKWYSCRIKSYESGGKYNLVYDDGDEEAAVDISRIRRLPVATLETSSTLKDVNQNYNETQFESSPQRGSASELADNKGTKEEDIWQAYLAELSDGEEEAGKQGKDEYDDDFVS